MCGVMHRTLMKKTKKETRLRFYETMTVLVLLYGCEKCAPTKKIKKQIQSSEIKFLRRSKGYTLSLIHI